MSSKSIDDIKTVMVAGAGTLGLRIALRCAYDGYAVKLYDIHNEQLEAAQAMQAKLTSRFLRHGKITQTQADLANANLIVTNDIGEATRDIDLVSESVIENVELKKEFYRDLTPRLDNDVVVTTNTSYLLPSDLIDSIAHPEQFCALHFHDVFNQLIVDVMPHAATSQSVVDLLMSFGKSINQIPVYVKKEHSGYMFNAMLMAILGEASDLFINGVGSFQDIDRSFMGNFGTVSGPFGMMDQVGLDTVLHILSARNDARSIALSEVIKSYTDKGELGYKSGKGFYSYPGPEFAQKEFLKA